MTNALATRHALTDFRPTAHRQAMSFTRLDDLVFSRAADAAPILPESTDRIARSLSTPQTDAATFLFDGFAAMFRHDPQQSTMGLPLAKEVISRLMADDRFPELRECTVADEVASALGATALTTAVAELLPQELKQKAEAERKAREDAEDASSYAETLANDGDATAEEVADARAARDRAKAKAGSAYVALQNEIRDRGQQIATAVAKGTGAAIGDAIAAKSVGNAFGTGSVNPSDSMDIAARLQLAKLAQKSGPAFAELLKIIGNLIQDRAEKAARKFRHDSGEVAEVGQGSEIDRLLDEELAALVDSNDALGLARYADDQMDQIEVDQKESAVKGDVIILFDESGSMGSKVSPNAPDGCTREAEAKGLTIAIAHAMLKDRRTVRVLFFQSSVTHRIEITPADISRRVNGMPVASAKLAEIAARGLGGGTLFDGPLNEAIDTLEAGRMPGADVLMLTDGESAVSDRTKARVEAIRAAHGVTFYALAIGSDAKRSVPVFERFADRVFSGDSLMSGAASQLMDLI